MGMMECLHLRKITPKRPVSPPCAEEGKKYHPHKRDAEEEHCRKAAQGVRNNLSVQPQPDG